VNDEILESVKEGFAPVRMDRPLEAIEARGRAYRRNRMLTGLGVMGLVVGLGVALVLPTTDLAAHRDDNVAQTAVATPTHGQRMEHVSFTLTSTADGTVTVTVKQAAADPKALEKALAGAGITAMVRVNEACGTRTPLPANQLEDIVQLGSRGASAPSSAPSSRRPSTLTIDGTRMPKDATLFVSLFVDDKTVVYGLGAMLSVTGSPVICKPQA
jgi:hypothetical protein